MLKVHFNDERLVRGMSQGYLVELASDGETAPKAALARSSTSRIKCGDNGFQHGLFDVQHHSCTGDLHQIRTEVALRLYTGDNFASMSSVLNKFLFGEMPNSNCFDEFSERLQIVLFTLGDSVLNAVYNTTADVLHVPRVLEVMARGWESLNAKAEVARVHRDGHCLEAMMWYRPLEDFGRWQTHAGRELPKGDDPRTDHRKGADSNLPGWQPKETAS